MHGCKHLTKLFFFLNRPLFQREQNEKTWTLLSINVVYIIYLLCIDGIRYIGSEICVKKLLLHILKIVKYLQITIKITLFLTLKVSRVIFFVFFIQRTPQGLHDAFYAKSMTTVNVFEHCLPKQKTKLIDCCMYIRLTL